MQAPCKGCEEREVGCHAGCAKYLELQAGQRSPGNQFSRGNGQAADEKDKEKMNNRKKG